MVDVWALFLMLLKLLSYSAVVSGIGAVLLFTLLPLRSTFDQYGSNRFQFWLNRWLINWSAAGMILALLQLPLQAGAMAESGPAAMMDTIMLNIVWQSAIGSQTVIRFSGFAALLFAALLWSGWGKDTIVAWIVAWILAFSGIVSLGTSNIAFARAGDCSLGWCIVAA